MTGSTARLQAIQGVEAYVPPAGSYVPAETPGQIFGENVFNRSAMKDWAMEKGATHYAHVCYPLTGSHRGEARQLPGPRR